MIRTTLDTLDSDQIAAAFNTVYTGYFMPFNVDAAWVNHLPERNSIVFSHSPIWLDESGSVIAMAALGMRDERGWVGGFGVAPIYRGRGLSHELTQTVLAHAEAAGIRLLRLEVLNQNVAAIRAYLGAGFRHERDLLSLAVDLPADSMDVAKPLDRAVEPELFETRARMAVVRPAWQRETSSLSSIAGLRANVLGALDAPRAIGIYVSSGAGMRLVDAAALNDEAARELLQVIAPRSPGHELTLWNEPETSELLPALYDAGWVDFLRQHEMVIDLS